MSIDTATIATTDLTNVLCQAFANQEFSALGTNSDGDTYHINYRVEFTELNDNRLLQIRLTDTDEVYRIRLITSVV